MKKRSAEYWKERFEQIEKAEHSIGQGCFADIDKQYKAAQKAIEADIDRWYRRFAENNEISLTEARRWLTGKDLQEFKWDVHEYIRHGEENAVSQEWVKELENASARFHISRLDAMKLQLQQHAEVLFGNQQDSIDAAMRKVYEDDYYHTAYEIQKGIGVGWDFGKLDERRIEKVINKPWAADGRNFSDRVWTNKQKLIEELQSTFTQGVILGKDPQKTIDVIAERLRVSKSNAGRLVMTEQAAFASAAQQDCYKDLGVEEYEIVATLDNHTSDICRAMDGQHFKMSEYEVGITAPPFHVWCRSTTVPYFDDEWGRSGERAARDKEGRTYSVSADMTYKEWQKAFIEDGGKTKDFPLTTSDTDTIIIHVGKDQNYESTAVDNSDRIKTTNYTGVSASRVAGIKEPYYIADGTVVKPKQLHEIHKNIEQSMKLMGIADDSRRPAIVIVNDTEMSTNAIAAYSAVDNVIKVFVGLGNRKKQSTLITGVAVPGNPLSTYVHELYHWKDAQKFIQAHGPISEENYSEYLKEINSEAEIFIEKLTKKGYDIHGISAYASKSFGKRNFDEVRTEYRTKVMLDGQV